MGIRMPVTSLPMTTIISPSAILALRTITTVDSWARHWRIVDEIMRQLLSHFATFEIARAEYPAVFPKNSYREMLEDYRYVFGVLGAEVHMVSDGIDHLHEDQRKILRPLWEAGKNADGTGAYERSEHVKRIIARRRAENLARESSPWKEPMKRLHNAEVAEACRRYRDERTSGLGRSSKQRQWRG